MMVFPVFNQILTIQMIIPEILIMKRIVKFSKLQLKNILFHSIGENVDHETQERLSYLNQVHHPMVEFLHH